MSSTAKGDLDYSEFDADRRSFPYRLTWKDFFRLHRISRRVAGKHGIKDAKARESHLRLIFELWTHMSSQSRTYLEDGSIKIAADAPDLKSVTEDILPDLNKHLSKVVELLHKMEGNEVFLTLLMDAAAEDDSPADQIWGLIAFAETVARAEEFKGKPGKKRNPDWVTEFCISCQRFWYEQELGTTRFNFRAPNPPPICTWVLMLFRELRDYRTTVDSSFQRPRAAVDSALESAAKNLPAYRPKERG